MTDPDAFIRHIRACTNAQLPGRRTRLRLGTAEIGWVAPEHAPRQPIADRAGFDRYVAALRDARAFRPRAEAFDVRDDAGGAVVATVDRGALPLLGIRACGVHLNGLVRRGDGLHVWIGRRAADKRLDPGKLDHLTAGGVPAGYDALATLLKEGAEEASLPPALARQAVAAGTLDYAMERAEGLRRDRLFCFDLDLPQDFAPRPNDGEVVEFTLRPIGEVAEQVARTDAFKFNVTLVLIDLFLRTGTIDRTSPAGQAIDRALQPLRWRPAGV